MAVPSCTDDIAGLATAGNVRIRGVNPLMASGTCLFPKSDDLGLTGVSTISSMTTEEGGVGVIWPRGFSKYSSQSFLDPTDIALQLTSNWTVGGHKLATIQSPLRTISLSIQMIPRSTKLCACAWSTLQLNRAWLSSLSQNEQIPQTNPKVPIPLKSR